MARLLHNFGSVKALWVILPFAALAGFSAACWACPPRNSPDPPARDLILRPGAEQGYKLVRVSFVYSSGGRGTLRPALKELILSMDRECRKHQARLLFQVNVPLRGSLYGHTEVNFVGIREECFPAFRDGLLREVPAGERFDLREVPRDLQIRLVTRKGLRKTGVARMMDVFELFDAGKTQVPLVRFDELWVAPIGDPPLWRGFAKAATIPRY